MNIPSLLAQLHEGPQSLHSIDIDGLGHIGASVSIEGDGRLFHPCVTIWHDYPDDKQRVRLFALDMIEALRDLLNEHFPKEGE